MRRSSTLLAVVFGLLLSALPATLPVAMADPSSPPTDPALGTAGRILAGGARAGDVSATLALRDLWLARPDLTGVDALEATALLARPTDGAADPYGDGYTVPSTGQCGTHVCVHYVPTTADAPLSPEWVALTLSTLETVYDREVHQLGYRAPRGDGTAGGDSRLDVYLKDLPPGLYGYCAAERRKTAHTASAFCVLDNDYSPTEFPAQTPQANLEVTAAHEFFHAVQYSYDYTEDPWMLESTATWMEDQVFDDINDNRQYLRYSQLQAAFVPLDVFSSTYGFQYGNWIFWEYLTERFGTGFVKKAWQSAGSLHKDGQRYSVPAIQAVLRKKHKSFTDVYADFAAANISPSHTYAEAPGVPEYANPDVLADITLTASRRKHTQRAKLDHLAADAIHVRPNSSYTNKRWRLRVGVRGPARAASPAARVLLFKTNGSVSVHNVRFSNRGLATTVVPFRSGKIAAVTVVFANVSTRFNCHRGTDLVCSGKAIDDNRRFTIHTSAFKARKKHH